MDDKLVLSEFVQEAIPNYYSQMSQLPASIVNQMERITRNFL